MVCIGHRLQCKLANLIPTIISCYFSLPIDYLRDTILVGFGQLFLTINQDEFELRVDCFLYDVSLILV